MAVVKNPALSMKASGNLGAICYSQHNGLNVARAAWTGTVPNTVDQQVIQAFMTAVSQAWGGTLSSTDREAWRKAAQIVRFPSRLGDQIKLSGYNYFVKLNMVRRVMGLAITNLPLIDEKNPLAIDLQVRNSILHTHVDVYFLENEDIDNPEYVDADKYQIFRAGPYNSGGRHAIAGEYRQIVIAPPGAKYHDLMLENEKFYWYKVRALVNSGKAGNFFEKQIFIEADPGILIDLLCWIVWDIGTGPINVPAWPDQTVNANDYSAIGVEIPGKSATGVDADGINDLMTNDNIFFTSDMWQRNQDFTIVAVITPEVIDGAHKILGLGQTVDNNSSAGMTIRNNMLIGGIPKDRMTLSVTDSTNMQVDLWASDDTVEVLVNEVQIWTIIQKVNEIEIYLNNGSNVAVHRNVGNIGGAAFHNEETMIFAAERQAGKLAFYNGEMQENLVWERAITQFERDEVISDLMIKYAIT